MVGGRAEQMLADTRPDVFCFVTQPHLRLPMVPVTAATRQKLEKLLTELGLLKSAPPSAKA